MTYNELVKKYHILVPLDVENKKVLLCANKIDNAFAFFEKQDNCFVEPNKTITDKLNSVFERPRTPYFFITLDSSLSQKMKTSVVPALEKTLKDILDELSFLNKDILSRIQDNFKHLTIMEEDYDESKGICKKENVTAFYNPTDNSMSIPSASLKFKPEFFTYYVQHELIHCASSNRSLNKTGFSDTISCYDKNALFVIPAYLGLTEVMTEYVNIYIYKNQGRTRPDPQHISYDYSRIILTPLLECLDLNKLFTYFFGCDCDGFVDYFANVFHLNNTMQVYRLFNLVDACIQAETKGRDINLLYQCYSELLKSSFDIMLNKYVVEGKNLSNLTLSSWLRDYSSYYDQNLVYARLKASNEIKQYFESAKFCFSRLKNCLQFDLNLSRKDYSEKFGIILRSIMYGMPLLYDDNFEKYKTFEIYSLILSIQNYGIMNNHAYSLNYQAIFSLLFNPNNNYLPKNKVKAEQLITKFLSINQNYNFDMVSIIDTKMLMDICNKNKALFKVLFPKHEKLFLDNLELLSDERKEYNKFYRAFMNKCAKLDSTSGLKLVYDYYMSFSLKNRTDIDFQYQLMEDVEAYIFKNKPNNMYKQFCKLLSLEQEQYLSELRSNKH